MVSCAAINSTLIYKDKLISLISAYVSCKICSFLSPSLDCSASELFCLYFSLQWTGWLLMCQSPMDQLVEYPLSQFQSPNGQPAAHISILNGLANCSYFNSQLTSWWNTHCHYFNPQWTSQQTSQLSILNGLMVWSEQ